MKKTELKRKSPLKKTWLKEDGTPKKGKTKSGKSRVSTVKARIDKLMGKVVRAQGTCFAEGENGWRCSQRFENCHIISRGEPSLFCHPSNLVCMCNVHHRFYTVREALWRELVDRKIPGRYDELLRIGVIHRETKQKVDWDAWEQYWKELLAEMEAA